VRVGDEGPPVGPEQEGPGPDQTAPSASWVDPLAQQQAPWNDPPGVRQPRPAARRRSTPTVRGPAGPALAVVGIVAALLFYAITDRGGGGSPPSVGVYSRVLRWNPDAGDAITPAEFRSVESNAAMDAVRAELGKPASTGSNPLDQVSGEQQCLGYASRSGTTLYVFCFAGGRLVQKETW
jgi:hypothetical protein